MTHRFFRTKIKDVAEPQIQSYTLNCGGFAGGAYTRLRICLFRTMPLFESFFSRVGTCRAEDTGG